MNALASIGTPFIPSWEQLRPFLAELWLIAAIIATLIAPFFLRRSNAACGLIALAGLAAALFGLLAVSPHAASAGSQFRGLLVSDHVAVLFKALLLLFVMGVVLMWFASASVTMREGDGPEYFTLLLGATLGMSLMASTSNLLMLVMAVELASLPSYVLAGFRKTHRLGAEASLKYVLFGAASSSIMVFGISILYGLHGTLQIDSTVLDGGAHVAGLAQRMAATPGGALLLVVGVGGLIVGLGSKISAVPLHFWCPDVFEGASIDVSTFLSVASKGAALVLLLRILMLIADALGYHNAPHLSLTALAAVVGVLGAITCTVGNTAAFVQNNIKRLLAYSSIAHAGYMLCVLALLLSRGDFQVTSARGINAPAQALLLYLAAYLFMNLGAFTVAGLIWRATGSEDIRSYAGLCRRNPLLAFCMLLFMLSLIGLPPLAGFVAKVNVLWVLIQGGRWYWALVAVIGVNTVLSLYYYARVIKVMYLQESDQPPFLASPVGTALSLVCAAALVLMFLGFQPLSRLTRDYSILHLPAAQATPAPPVVGTPSQPSPALPHASAEIP